MRIAKENNLQAPDFEQSDDFKAVLYRPSTVGVQTMYPPSTPQVPPKYPSTSVEVLNLIRVLNNELSRAEIQEILGLKDPKNFRENYLEPALAAGIVKMKYPDSPNHPKQRYLLTEKGNDIKKQS